MKRTFLIIAAFMLGGASMAQAAPAHRGAVDGYPVCSRGVTDNCMQAGSSAGTHRMVRHREMERAEHRHSARHGRHHRVAHRTHRRAAHRHLHHTAAVKPAPARTH